MTTAKKPMRIVVGMDGSDMAMASLTLVNAIDWPTDSAIDIVTVTQPVAPIGAGPWALAAPPWTPTSERYAAEVDTEFQRRSQALIDTARVHVTRPGLRVGGAVLSGRPAVAILDRAQTTDADLIVVGSRGHSTIQTMVLGSVSAEIIDHADRPVLVARSTGMDRVVLAVDGSGAAADATQLLADWSIFRKTSVLALSVAPLPPPWWTGLRDVALPEAIDAYDAMAGMSHDIHERLAAEAVRQLHEQGIVAEPRRGEGDPAPQIIQAAKAWDADLIVVGTRGLTGVRRVMLGSTARNVLAHATCSVLVVKDPLTVTATATSGD